MNFTKHKYEIHTIPGRHINMPKSSAPVRFTICLPTSLNEDFEELLHKRKEKRQKAIRELIHRWVREMEAKEAAEDNEAA